MTIRLIQGADIKEYRTEMHTGPSGSMCCTGYEYGAEIARLTKADIVEISGARIEVYDGGRPVHILVPVKKDDGYEFSDRAEDGLRAEFGFERPSGKLETKYLYLVDPARNLNRSYKMADLGKGEWSATYGDVGAKQGRSRRNRNITLPRKYPDYMYPIKYMCKMLEGYTDESECHKPTVTRKLKSDALDVSGIKDKAVAKLISDLSASASEAIAENYEISCTDVTQAMIEKASRELKLMRKSMSLEEFNKYLNALLRTMPRKSDGRVKDMFASSAADYGKILTRETELLDIMESQIRMEEAPKTETDILERLGLAITEAGIRDCDAVTGMLSDSLRPFVSNIYRVTNLKTQESFNKRLEKETEAHGKKPKLKLLWHGSRNRNWLSILQKGLLLNPDAQITGKMFGYGIYFAPSSMKSWGYASSSRSKWNSDSENKAYMGVFETMYGNPFEVFDYNGAYGSMTGDRFEKEHPGCGCLHAKSSGGMLRNDEIIFYNEDRVTIKYLVEFTV